MTIELKLTTLPESVSEATLVSWYKKPGEQVKQDEKLADIETDKVILDIPSPVSGILTKIIIPEDTIIQAETIIGLIEEGDSAAMDTPDTVQNPVSMPENQGKIALSPAVRNMLNEFNLDPAVITATGKRGRLLKSDIIHYLEKNSVQSETKSKQSVSESSHESVPTPVRENITDAKPSEKRTPRRVPMSRIRASIAKRLVEAQQNAAILTTFNEVDLTEVIAIRKEFAESFIKKISLNWVLCLFLLRQRLIH